MSTAQQQALVAIEAAVQGANGTVASYSLPNTSNVPVAVKITIPPSTAIGLSIDYNGMIQVLSIT